VLTTFDRHLLREWLRILGLVLLATIGLLVVQVMLDDFRDLREYGAGAWDGVMYFVVTIPSFLALVLPLALLVSLLYALGRLHRANELTAMRAAGVGFLRLTRPIWAVGVLCCALVWLLNSKVVPWSVEESRTRSEMLQLRQQQDLPLDRRGAVGAVVFNNPEEGRMWFINRYGRFMETAYGVTVSLLDPDTRRETGRIVAAEGRRLPQGGWEFLDGRSYTFNGETGDMEDPARFARVTYPEFDEVPGLMMLIDRRPEDLSLDELRAIRDHLRATGSPKQIPYAVRYASLLADTLSPLIVIAIAIPFAVSGVRMNPAVGVAKSIGLFFLYYLLATLGRALAVKGLVPPELAAWIPNIALSLFAAGLFVRLR
jgi:lipopolysaccharide export system permease protein